MKFVRLSMAVLVVPAFLLGTRLPARAQASDDIPISEWEPLPPADEIEVSDAARALREKLLGPRALDPNYVTLSWIGVSSFVVTISGHLLLFDAWEIVGVQKDYLPIGREELAGLEPEAIMVGHGHFDHGADVGYVAGKTGAAVVGSEEICQRAREDASYDGVGQDFPCAVTGTATTPEPGTMQTLRLFADVKPISVLQHVHSAARPPGDGNEPNPFVPVFDPAPYINNPNVSPEEYQRFLRSQSAAQGGTWMYHFRIGDFTLLLGNSAGPIYEYPKVAKALRSFPGCVDVMANAILGFNQPVSGLKDPVLYLKKVSPSVFLPTHADAWVPGLSAGQDAYIDQFETEMEQRLKNPPSVDWMIDPEDYLVERAYRVDGARWRKAPAGSACAARSRGRDNGVDATGEPDPPAGEGSQGGTGSGGVDDADGADAGASQEPEAPEGRAATPFTGAQVMLFLVIAVVAIGAGAFLWALRPRRR